MKVNSVEAAWREADRLIPNDYSQDFESSSRAGYPIYRSNIEYYDYICDLGDRLEVNLKEGNRSINIWIEEDDVYITENPSKEDIKEAASHQYTFEPENVQLVRVFVMGYKFESEANRNVFRIMNQSAEFHQKSIAADLVEAYCDDKGILWGTIRVINVTKYENTKNCDEGHFVIEAIVGERVKS